MAVQLDNGNVLCEQCGNEYKCVGQHWTMSNSCEHAELSDYKKEILTGLLMGDGYATNQNGKNQHIRTAMISENYLYHLDQELGWMSTGVSFHISAEENAKKSRDSGFSPNAEKENYSDVYRFNTRSHPFITKLTSWYDSGSKVWPEDVELTPTVLKHWYCGDGHYDDSGGQRYIKIAMSNEADNTEKVERYFERVGLPTPSSWSISDNTCNAQFTVSQSKALFEYIGEPLPDFRYKWPSDMGGTGTSMADVEPWEPSDSTETPQMALSDD